jgi:hypothetical protein
MDGRERRRARRISRGIDPWYRREVGGAPYWLLITAVVVALGVLAVVFTIGPGRPLWEQFISGA